MKDLIEALQILLKYGNPDYPTHCDHDELRICGYEPEKITPEDVKRLKELGFEVVIEGDLIDPEEGEDSDVHDESMIFSYKYGSC